MIGGTRGGLNRARIINLLEKQPLNANQLSEDLGLDYSTIRHHLDVLMKNKMVGSLGDGYGMVYILSDELVDNYVFFEEIWERIGNKEKNSDEDGF